MALFIILFEFIKEIKKKINILVIDKLSTHYNSLLTNE